MLAGKLVLARMDNSAAAAYANYGAGRVSQLTVLARKIKEREVAMGCTLAALLIAGRDNSAADALSRFSIRVRGLGPYPERELRWRFRKEVKRLCGSADVDMLASDDGRKAWVANSRLPSNSAFEGPSLHGRLAAPNNRDGGISPGPYRSIHAGRVAGGAPCPRPIDPLEALAPETGPV